MKEIPLGWKGPNKGKHVALVDDADFDWLIQWRWYAHKEYKSFYAQRSLGLDSNGKQLRVRMHRLILGLSSSDKREGDHINGNTLDNRRENLRIVTHQQNMWNQHGMAGACWFKEKKKFKAQIHVKGKNIHLGLFITFEDASRAYWDAKKRYHQAVQLQVNPAGGPAPCEMGCGRIGTQAHHCVKRSQEPGPRFKYEPLWGLWLCTTCHGLADTTPDEFVVAALNRLRIVRPPKAKTLALYVERHDRLQCPDVTFQWMREYLRRRVAKLQRCWADAYCADL